MNLTVVIFKQLDSEHKSVHFKENIYYLNSNLCSRQDAFSIWQERWILFFDHDCVFTEKLIVEVLKELAHFDHSQVLAGFYKNPIGANFLQRAHNFIANQWLSRSSNESIKNILGGFFAIYSTALLVDLDYSNLPKWGAEDKALSRLLQNSGFQIQICKKLSVEHNTSRKISHFIKRAWFHGSHFQRTYDLNTKVNLVEEIRIWIRETRGLDRSARFFVCIHFLILVLAKLIQEVRQTSK